MGIDQPPAGPSRTSTQVLWLATCRLVLNTARGAQKFHKSHYLIRYIITADSIFKCNEDNNGHGFRRMEWPAPLCS